MSDNLLDLWNAAKSGLEKSAANPLKLLPAIAGESRAVAKVAPKIADDLAIVERNIAGGGGIPPMRTVTGPARDVKPLALPGPAGKVMDAKTPMTLKSLLRGARENVAGNWNKLSPRMQSTIKGTGLVGAGAVAGHADGKATGMEEGLTQGATKGFDAGIQAGAQQSAIDPGILGRLLEVFTGRQPSAISATDPVVASQRQQAIQKILAGR